MPRSVLRAHPRSLTGGVGGRGVSKPVFTRTLTALSPLGSPCSPQTPFGLLLFFNGEPGFQPPGSELSSFPEHWALHKCHGLWLSRKQGRGHQSVPEQAPGASPWVLLLVLLQDGDFGVQGEAVLGARLEGCQQGPCLWGPSRA